MQVLAFSFAALAARRARGGRVAAKEGGAAGGKKPPKPPPRVNQHLGVPGVGRISVRATQLRYRALANLFFFS